MTRILYLGLGLIAAVCALCPLVPTATATSAPARTGRVYSTQLPARGNEALLGVGVSSDGTVWVSDQADEDLIAISPGGQRRYIALGRGALLDVEDHNSDVWPVGAVYAAPDGSVYVAERGALARMTSVGVQRFGIPSGSYASPGAFATGPDGAIWFTEVNRADIGRFDPVTAQITEFPDGTGGHGTPAGGIASGPDGRLWYTLPNDNDPEGKLGAIAVNGTTSIYKPHVQGLLESALGVVADRGPLWVLGSRFGQARPGQLQSALLRVTPGPRTPAVTRVSPSLGDAAGDFALARGGTLYATGGALGASGNIVSVTEHGLVTHYGRANGQVSLFGSAGNTPALAAAPDGSVWLGADGGVLEHLLPGAAEPCVVPRVVGYKAASAQARLRHGHCLASVGAVRGSPDTPAIVTAQQAHADTVLDPGSKVKLTIKRGVPYACDPTGNSNPDLTVLRVSCASARHLFHLVYDRATVKGTARAEGFRCRYDKHTAIPEMGGGKVDCRARDPRHRLRLVDMYWTPPR